MGGVRIVAGRWGGRRLRTPRGAATRPTQERVREAWMSMLAAELENARVLDLFAGSGALGLEALSRGAAHATFVERDRRALECLRANLASLGAEERSRVIARDVFGYLAELQAGTFDLAFADPPYGRGQAERLVRSFRARPFARTLALEYGSREAVELPDRARSRRYGDTMVALIPANENENGGEGP